MKPAPLPPLSLINLRWLLVSMALVLAPMFLHLTPWVPIFALLIGAWRYSLAVRQQPLPGTRILLPMTLLSAGAIVASYGGSFGRDASVALLTLMLSMKLLESNNRRDAMLLISLSWFLSITTFLFTQSLLMGLYLAMPVFTLTITLLGISHPNGILPFRTHWRLAASLLGQAIPVMLVLFMLFPRLAGPLWQMPSDATKAMTGLSESMSPGSISELSRSDETAFRAEFSGELPAPNQRYWRGPILWHFDGRTWRPGMQSLNPSEESLADKSDAVDYTVTLEPHNRTWLFALDVPATTPVEGLMRPDHQLVARQPVNSRVRYQTRSFLTYRLQPELDEKTRLSALQLPKRGNLRTRELGKEWSTSGLEGEALVRKALAIYNDEPFVYTLSPPLLGRDGVDEFLFTTRRGFCEHYASSFVFLMRAAGMPARIVTGYQGGVVNPLGNYMIVRQSDAHAWAEVWLKNSGWVRIDPTAAVSPQRIESGLSNLPAGEPVPLLARSGRSWMNQIYLGWDAINNGWNQWVLGYNQQRQLELLERFLGDKVSMYGLAIGMIAAVGLIMLAISWGLLRSAVRKLDRLETAYRKFQRKLARVGILHEPHEGPLDFGRRAAAAMPEKARSVMDITTLYAHLRYGNTQTPDNIKTLEKEIREFKA
jgi:transglutaminase-like putative cysteine protease